MTDLKLTRREQARTRTQNSSKTVKDLQDKGKKVKRFYGDKAYDADEVYETGVKVVVPPRENASAMRGHPARRKALREFKRLGYNRWREKEGYGFRWRVESLFSAVKRSFGESV
jgi:IS5 family transposase